MKKEEADYIKIMSDCTLCPRNCHANRLGGKTGYCGQTAEIKAARAALHFWEEPCISGDNGSGTVFFSGCVLRCVFCQNRNIAESRAGREITVERLADIFLELQEKKANNINLVTPTHFVPRIALALERAKEAGLRIPVVYNTGSYEKADTLKRMDGLVDIYLPDMKYVSPALAQRAEFDEIKDYREFTTQERKALEQGGIISLIPSMKELMDYLLDVKEVEEEECMFLVSELLHEGMLGVDIENFIAECGDMLRDNDIRMTHRFREMVEAVLEECPSAVLKGYSMKEYGKMMEE